MKQNLKTALRGSLAVLLILSLLQPFGIDQLGEERLPFILGQTLCTFVCLFVIDWSLMRVTPRLVNPRGKSLPQLILILIPQFIIVTLAMGAVILCYDCWFQWGNIRYGWFDEEGFTLRPYFSVLWQVAYISFFVFVWVLYQMRNSNLNEELTELRALNRLLEERQAKEADEAPEAMLEAPTQTCLIESSTHQTLEVNPRDIVYIESMSNYADICHVIEGETRHTTLRITLKQLRESLAEAECLVTCHRAFIVNMNFIVSIASRPSGGYQLEVFGTDKLIPVSRSCTDEIKRRMK